MSSTASEDSRVQPWKAHWPAAENDSKSTLKYRADDSGSLLVDGVCTNGEMGLCELARSSKEDEALKVTTAKTAYCFVLLSKDVQSDRKKYLVDDSGSLLVDGMCSGGWGMGLCELARSRKGEGKE